MVLKKNSYQKYANDNGVEKRRSIEICQGVEKKIVNRNMSMIMVLKKDRYQKYANDFTVATINKHGQKK